MPPSILPSRPTLLVVIDTEEEFDWSAPFDRKNIGVAHMRDLGALQAVFDEFAIRPLYAVDQPIATQPESAGPLREIHASGRCEIGAHLHPWVSPPFDEEVNARNSYPGNLPHDLERKKLESLVAAIEQNLGVRPRSYKAGRYGFGANTAATLAELGFEVDLSILPSFDLSSDGGPDYSRSTPEPRWIGAGLLSLPATAAFIGFARGAAPSLHRLASSRSFARAGATGILARLGAIERLMLSPEGYLPQHHRRLTHALLERGIRVFSFTLHSPSIRPGCTPYVKTDRDREKFLDACRRYFDFFLRELGGASLTPLELKRHLETSPAPARA